MSAGPGGDVVAAERARTLEQRAAILAEIQDAVVATDRDGRITYWNDSAASIFGYTAEEMIGRTPDVLYPGGSAAATLPGTAPRPGETFDGEWQGRRKDGSLVWLLVHVRPVGDGNGGHLGGIATALDISPWKREQVERSRLAAAVEQSADSVVITDPEARIIYVNPAFERVSGYREEEVLGRNPNVLQSGRMPLTFYQAMWATLTAGRTWRGELINRRKDGTTLIEEASITPVFGEAGELLHYVGVKRDVTAARALEQRLNSRVDQQASISAMVADLAPGATPEATARAVCDRFLTVPRIAYAAVALFEPGDRLRLLAATGVDRVEIPPLGPDGPWPTVFARRARHLRDEVRRGPTVEPWPSGFSTPMAETYQRLGIRGLARSPLWSDGELIGFIQAGATGEDAIAVLEGVLPTLAAFGVLASLLLAPQLGQAARSEQRADAVRKLIARRAFRPVYQPIMALTTGSVVGYEALTRFNDGVAPDLHFAAALEAGVGIELEFATLEAAIDGSRSLPRDAWLDLNVSGAVLDDPSRLAYLLWKAAGRAIVLEVTEHEEIPDYVQLRRRVEELGVKVRLAVDDAGAGFASMRHILELRPDVIKLDRSLIANLGADPVRQGLVAGLRHFATTAGSTLIGEGIETEAECAALISLGVDLGQGYLLGRPNSVAQLRRATPARKPTVLAVDDVGGSRESLHRVNAILWEADGTDERMTFVSRGAAALTGHAPARWLMEPRFWEDHVHEDDRQAALDAVGAAIDARHGVSIEYRFRTADGSYRWFEDLIEVLPGPDGHSRLVGVMIDITDRHRLEDELAYRASHDLLTGLLNRQGFAERVTRNLALGTSCAAVIFIDLDDFKVVNDSLGHRAGDELLVLIADRIRSAVRDPDAVARFGGDEFLVFARADDEDGLLALADRIVTVVAEPSLVGGRPMRHAASAGIAILTQGDTADSAIRNADLAMYAAKRRGGNRVAAFEPAMHEAAVGRLGTAPG